MREGKSQAVGIIKGAFVLRSGAGLLHQRRCIHQRVRQRQVASSTMLFNWLWLFQGTHQKSQYKSLLHLLHLLNAWSWGKLASCTILRLSGRVCQQWQFSKNTWSWGKLASCTKLLLFGRVCQQWQLEHVAVEHSCSVSVPPNVPPRCQKHLLVFNRLKRKKHCTVWLASRKQNFTGY